MAKSPTFDTITAGFASATKLNSNFSSISTSFNNTLSLDGSTPNAMTADFDLGGNDLLNGGDATFTDVTVGGTSIAAQATAAAASATAAATSETNAAASAATAATLTVFTSLTDVPSSYSGDGTKFVRVNAGETALEFATVTGSEPSDGDKGDITVSASGLTWSIDAGVIGATELGTDAVTTAKILNDNVTYAKLQNVVANNVVLGNNSGAGTEVAELTTAQLTALVDDFTDALSGGVPASSGGTTNFLRADQTWATPPNGAPTIGTALTTTSGTTQSFTGLPAALNEIKVLLSGVSLSGTDALLIQLGDAGGFEVTGYVSSASKAGNSASDTTGFRLTQNTGATKLWSGEIVVSRINGNEWISAGQLHSGTDVINLSVGSKTLSAELTQIRLATTGSNTFDAGTVNVHYQ